MTQLAFDAAKYKETTRQQWQEAAEAWNRWGPLLNQWLGAATETMLDMARVTEGSRVLDVAAGAGDQTLMAARRAGPEGRVLATDISPAILEFAAENARRAGLDNVEVKAVDGEALDVEAGGFDAAISRVGLIYFPDQQKALAGIRRGLRDGGRFSAMVYSTADHNGFFSLPVSIIMRRAELSPPAPGRPGPFSLGAEGALEDALATAGFRDIEVQRMEAPVRLPSAAECLRFERESFGALHQMLSGLPEARREAAWDEIATELKRYETPDGFVGPCEMLIGAGVK
jgi:SAM-dependent methyltransferase